MKLAKFAALAIIFGIAFLTFSEISVEARRGGIVRWGYRALKRSYVRPSFGKVVLGTAAGAAVGTVVGEMAYDAFQPDEEQQRNQEQPQGYNQDAKQFDPEQKQMQPRSNCRCQGN